MVDSKYRGLSKPTYYCIEFRDNLVNAINENYQIGCNWEQINDILITPQGFDLTINNQYYFVGYSWIEEE